MRKIIENKVASLVRLKSEYDSVLKQINILPEESKEYNFFCKKKNKT